MIFKFFFCDAGLASEDIRCYNHMGERAYIVTQSIKKLKKDGRQCALDPHGFKRVSDDHPADIAKLSADDKGLYYKDIRDSSLPTLQSIFNGFSDFSVHQLSKTGI